MESYTPAKSTRTKLRLFCLLKETQMNWERTNVDGKTAEERPDTDNSTSVSNSSMKKQI